MRTKRFFWTRGAAVLAFGFGLSAEALAQEAQRPATDTGGQSLTSGGALAPSSGAVDKSQGGVGGTGLGKMPSDSTDGKGLSVLGPAGQGLREMRPKP